ncbi:MAG: LAGLIDADG endonuclease [bacterium]
MVRSRQIEEYKQALRLTREQREALIGLLLGGAHLETQNRGRTYRLKIEQSESHRDYVEHLYHLFGLWVLTPPQPKHVVSQGHVSTNWWFQTISHGTFRFYAQQFYRDGHKRVPKLIHRWLKPRGLAYWFMDNGSVKGLAVLLNTQGFEQSDVERLRQVLIQQFGLEVSVRRQPEGHQIVIPECFLERWEELIGPYLPPEMAYKLPRAGRTQLPKR